jgi:hypothetical protein
MKTNCIICGTEVDNWDIAYPEGSNVVHPIGGTAFRTYGHYGSTVFDPMDASFLEIVICDTCLKDRLHYTYEGVNEQRRQELEDRRAEMDELLDSLGLVEFDD